VGYWLGGKRIAFNPNLDLLAVAFLEERPPTAQFVPKLEDLGLQVTAVLIDGAVYIFRLRTVAHRRIQLFAGDSGQKLKRDLVNEVQSLISIPGTRVGSPLDATEGRIQIIDRQYVVQFKASRKESDIIQLLLDGGVEEKVGYRKISYLPNTWLIAFRDGANPLRHLKVIDSWVMHGEIIFGEPNLVFQLRFSGAVTPNDPMFPNQTSLHLQRVPEAWDHLSSLPGAPKFGSPEVVVASLDKGVALTQDISASHPELDRAHLLQCIDLGPTGNCVAPTQDHGMEVYGIIAGEVDNSTGIAGIAPHTKHLAIAENDIKDCDRFARTLLWLAGLKGVDPLPKPGLQPLAKGADIINCSFDLSIVGVQSAVKQALDRIVNEGRDGCGAIIVCAAGNDYMNIDPSQMETMATLPTTIAVGNTYLRSEGQEIRYESSNWGWWLDLTALGQCSPSLISSPSAPAFVCSDLPDPSPGYTSFTGTSAAAAMVTGAAALILSVCPHLKWTAVREILRSTAQKIDVANPDPGAAWLRKSPTGSGSSWEQPTDGAKPATGLEWFSQWYGYGRLDVFGAVLKAHQYTEAGCPVACTQ